MVWASNRTTSMERDTGSPFKWTQRYTSMGTTDRNAYGSMSSVGRVCNSPSFANSQTDLEDVLRPREEVFLFSDSKKSLSQPYNSPIFGGLARSDSIQIPSNYFDDSLTAITWDVQESPQMVINNTQNLLNLTQESAELETLNQSYNNMLNTTIQ